ncbi:ferric reductase-like transmembrane domain-containing protein [Shimia sp.]|uniref:ferric reductase-like transmembrane domain-containing protein n=1 Tax=Shimia sp. TaxID=1954381 RepID=UPI003296B40A
MASRPTPKSARPTLIWLALLGAMTMPIIIAAFSPYLAYRDPAYIIAGFAGIICLALFLIQPLFAAGYLPGLHPMGARRWHRGIGSAIFLCVVLHIGGLYITSPPDTLDALMLVAPTPFSVYGVLATLGLLLTALLLILRRKRTLRYPLWRMLHNVLALGIVGATIIHALQIQGTMGPISKWLLCGAVLVVTCATLLDQRLIRPSRARRHALNHNN